MSMISASAAFALWKPYARRVMSRTLLLSASVRPWLMRRRIASRIPARCLRIVLPSDERFQAAAGQAGQQPLDQHLDVLEREADLEDAADGLFERVGAPDLAAGGLIRARVAVCWSVSFSGRLSRHQRASLKRLAASGWSRERSWFQ